MDIFKSTTTINKQQISYFVIAILVTLIAIFCSQINFTADQHNNNNNNNEDLNIIVTQNETDSVLLFNKSNNGSIMETIKSKTNNELIVIAGNMRLGACKELRLNFSLLKGFIDFSPAFSMLKAVPETPNFAFVLVTILAKNASHRSNSQKNKKLFYRDGNNVGFRH